jgi:hypothetical protein
VPPEWRKARPEKVQNGASYHKTGYCGAGQEVLNVDGIVKNRKLAHIQADADEQGSNGRDRTDPGFDGKFLFRHWTD